MRLLDDLPLYDATGLRVERNLPRGEDPAVGDDRL